MTTAPEASPFVRECQRLMTARQKATTTDERADAEWALEYLFQMHRAGRFEEYLAQRAAIDARAKEATGEQR